MGIGVLSQGVKQPECEINHSPPSSIENNRNYTSHLPYASMVRTGKVFPFHVQIQRAEPYYVDVKDKIRIPKILCERTVYSYYDFDKLVFL
jgi:hypothetical protein